MSAADHPSTQRTEREVEFFDQFVTQHGEYDVLSEGAYARLLGQFEALVSPRAGERCIDLGCGTGAFTRRLGRFGMRVEGMDISPVSVKYAQEHARGETYLCGDITATGLPDASYDVIVYSGVLHHFETREARQNVLREGARVLRPGGRLFAFDPNARSPSMWLYRDPRSPLYSPAGKTENEVLLHAPALAAELQDAGFTGVSIRGTSGITFKYVEGGVARRLLPLYNLYEHAVKVSPIERWIGTFLVTTARRGG